MAPPKNGTTVQLPELISHARAVVQMQQPLDRVVAAVKEVTPDGFDLAYGLICQPFALALMPVRESAEDTVRKISDSVEATSDQLIKTVDAYDKTDTGNAKALRGVGADLPTTDNGLIANGSGFSLGDYNPLDGGPMTNMQGQNRPKGAGMAGNAWDLYFEITDKSKQNYGTMVGHIASLGLDAVGAAADPIAAAAAMGTGWLIEHVKPLKLILDVQVGNPDTIKASAETWKNVGNELRRLSKHYAKAVEAGTGGWNGPAGDAYRERTAKTTIDALDAAGASALTMSVVVATTGELVNLVRTVTRDVIADAVGMAASAAAQRFIGYKPPLAELRHLLETARKCRKLLDFLLVLIGDLAPLFPKLVEVYKTLTNIVPKLNGI